MSDELRMFDFCIYPSYINFESPLKCVLFENLILYLLLDIFLMGVVKVLMSWHPWRIFYESAGKYFFYYTSYNLTVNKILPPVIFNSYYKYHLY